MPQDIMTAKPVQNRTFTFADQPGEHFQLELGGTLAPVTLAYEAYGRLSPERDNAILLFHALSGNQHAAGFNPDAPTMGDLWTEENHIGWWDGFIGPGKALDTDRYFVICANYLGGSYGSTAPCSNNPETGKPYGSTFPYITMSDVVNSQVRLLDHLGIEKLLATVGGSIGGMLSLDLAVRYPDRVKVVIPIASGAHATTLQKLHNFEQIFAIENDNNFNAGDYYDEEPPLKGLMTARMIGQKTFVSLEVLQRRARGEIFQDADDLKSYRLQHRIESYMLYQAKKFVKRFDPNAYLCVLGMWQAFDLTQATGGDLVKTFAPCSGQRYLNFSIDSDVCFYQNEQAQLTSALKENNIVVQHITVHSEKGHDSFLLEPELYTPYISFALNEVYS
jgi:homoserine O-acetyltransferase